MILGHRGTQISASEFARLLFPHLDPNKVAAALALVPVIARFTQRLRKPKQKSLPPCSSTASAVLPSAALPVVILCGQLQAARIPREFPCLRLLIVGLAVPEASVKVTADDHDGNPRGPSRAQCESRCL